MISKLLAKFSLVQTVTWIIPIVVSVFSSAYSNSEQWNSIVLGQLVGSIFAIIIMGGWGLRGPALLMNRAGSGEGIFLESLFQRCLSLLFLTPFLIFSGLLFSRSTDLLIYSISSVSYALLGCSPRWYYSATSQISRLFLIEIAPRMVSSLIAVIYLLWTGELTGFVTLVLLGQVLPVLLSVSKLEQLKTAIRQYSLKRYWSSCMDAGTLTFADALGSLYFASPLILGSFFLTLEQNAQLSSVWKVYAVALAFVAILTNTTQSAVITNADIERRSILGKSLALSFFLGFGGAAGLAMLGNQAASLLFSRHSPDSVIIFSVIAASFFSVTISTHYLRHSILFHLKFNKVLLANTLGFLVATISGSVLIVLKLLSVDSVALPYALAEVSVCIFVLVAASKIERQNTN